MNDLTTKHDPDVVEIARHIGERQKKAPNISARMVDGVGQITYGENSEPMPPESHSFMADIDAAFVQQIFHIAKRQRKPHAHHNCQADDLTARFKVEK